MFFYFVSTSSIPDRIQLLALEKPNSLIEGEINKRSSLRLSIFVYLTKCLFASLWESNLIMEVIDVYCIFRISHNSIKMPSRKKRVSPSITVAMIKGLLRYKRQSFNCILNSLGLTFNLTNDLHNADKRPLVGIENAKCDMRKCSDEADAFFTVGESDRWAAAKHFRVGYVIVKYERLCLLDWYTYVTTFEHYNPHLVSLTPLASLSCNESSQSSSWPITDKLQHAMLATKSKLLQLNLPKQLHHIRSH